MLITCKNIFIDLEFQEKNDMLLYLSNNLVDQRIVESSYPQALLDREKITPTGIQTKSLGVAIPHTDTNHVIIPQVSVATLKTPIMFNQMDDPQQIIEVCLVFMLAINNPDAQIDLLMKMSSILSNEQLLVDIVNSKNKEQILEYMKSIND